MEQTISKQKLTKRIVITGGGSGGHVAPAQGMLDTFEKCYANATDQILYIGGKLVSESFKTGKRGML